MSDFDYLDEKKRAVGPKTEFLTVDDLDIALPEMPGEGAYLSEKPLNNQRAIDLLKDGRFLQDASDYYWERDGKTFGSQEELVEYFFDDRTWKNTNTVSLAKELYDVNTQSEIQSQRLNRLQTVFDAHPDFWEEGGRGAYGLWQNIQSTVLDPINLIPIPAAKAAATAAVAGTRSAQLAARKAGQEYTGDSLLKAGLKAGAKSGAKNEALLAGGVGAGFDYGIQDRNVEIGLQDEISQMQIAAAGGLGALTGGIIGGGVGAGAAVFRNPLSSTSRNAIQEGASLGAKEFRGSVRAETARNAAEAEAAQTNGGPEAPSQAQIELDTAFDNLENQFDVYIKDLLDRKFANEPEYIAAAENVSLGKPTGIPEVDVASRRLGALQALRKSGERAKALRAQADEVAEADPTKAAELYQQANNLEEYYNRIARLALDGDDLGLEKALDAAPPETTGLPQDSVDDINAALNPTNTPEPQVNGSDAAAPTAGDEVEATVEAATPETSNTTAPDAPESSPEASSEAPSTQSAQEKYDALQAEYEEIVAKEKALRARIYRAKQKGVDKTPEQAQEQADLKTQRLENKAERSALKNEIAKEAADTEAQAAEAASGEAPANTPEMEAADTTLTDRDALLQETDEFLARIEDDYLADPVLTAERVGGKETDIADFFGNEIYGDMPEKFRTGIVQQVRKELRELTQGKTKTAKEAIRKQYVADNLRNMKLEGDLSEQLGRFAEPKEGADGLYYRPETFNANIMRPLLEAMYAGDPAYARDLVGMYDRWLENTAIDVFADAVNRVDNGSIDDALALISEEFGDSLVDTINVTLRGENDVMQRMAIKFENIKPYKLEGLPEEQQKVLDAISTKVIETGKNKGWTPEFTQMALNTVIEDRIKHLEIRTNDKGETYVYSKTGINPLSPNTNDHIGRRIEPGMDEGVQRRVGRRQSILKNSNRHGYHGRLYDLMVNGDTGVEYSAGESARRMIEDAAVERATNRVVKNPVKIAENKPRLDALQNDLTTPPSGLIPDALKMRRKALKAAKVPDLKKKLDELKSATITGIKNDPKRAQRDTLLSQITEIEEAATKHAASVTYDRDQAVQVIAWKNRIKEINERLAPTNKDIAPTRDPELELERETLSENLTELGKQKDAEYEAAFNDFAKKQNLKGLYDQKNKLDSEISNPFDNNAQIRELEERIAAAEVAAQKSLDEAAPALAQAQMGNSKIYTPLLDFDGYLAALRQEKRELSTSTDKQATGDVIERSRANNEKRAIEQLSAEVRQLRKRQAEEASTDDAAAIARSMEYETQINVLENKIRELDPEFFAEKETQRAKGKMRKRARKQLEEESGMEAAYEELRNLREQKANGTFVDDKIEKVEAKIARIESNVRQSLDKEDHGQIIARKALAEGEAARRGGALNTPEADAASVEAETGYTVDEYDQHIAVQAVDQVARVKNDQMNMNDEILAAAERFKDHGNPVQLAAEMAGIKAKYDVLTHNAQRTVPQGKQNALIVNHKGFEIDVLNHFKKGEEIGNGLGMHNMEFMGKTVGFYTKMADGKFSLHKTTSDGQVIKTYANKKAMARALPEFFEDHVVAAGKQGKLATSRAPENVSFAEPNWQNTKTYEDATPSVPEVDEDMPDVVEADENIVTTHDPLLDTPVSEAIPVRADRDLAIRIDSGPLQGAVRVVPKTRHHVPISEVLRRQVGQKITLGYASEGSSGARAAKTFHAINQEGPVSTLKSPEYSDDPNLKPKAQPIPVEKLGSVELTPDQIDLIGSDRFKTAVDVHDAAMNMENIRWDQFKSQEDFNAFVNELTKVYDTLAQVAPHGVKYPNATRRGTVNQLRTILASRPHEEMAAIMNVIRRIGGDSNLPRFVEAKDGYSYRPVNAGVNVGERNAIGIDINDALDQPDFAKTIHEIGHWAYVNVLSPEDRLNFWGAMQKYVREDGVDLAALKQRLPGGASNEIKSPAEFFANQFTQFALSRGYAGRQSMLAKFWTSLFNKVQAVAKRFFLSEQDELLDADLIPLFERILPDEAVSATKFTDLVKKFNIGRGTASFAAKKLDDYQLIRNELDEAIRSGNTDSIIASLKSYVSEIYSISGKAGSKFLSRRRIKDSEIGYGGGNRVRLFDGGKRLGEYVDRETEKTMIKVSDPNGYYMRGKMLRLMYEIQKTVRDYSTGRGLDVNLDLSQAERKQILENVELMELVQEQMLDDADTMRFTDEYTDEMGIRYEDEYGVDGMEAYIDEAQDTIYNTTIHSDEDTDAFEQKLEALANEAFNVLYEAQVTLKQKFNRNIPKTASGEGLAVNIDGELKVTKESPISKMHRKAAQKRRNNKEAKQKAEFAELQDNINGIFDEAAGSSTNQDVVPASTERSVRDMDLMELMEAYAKATRSRAKDRDARIRDLSAEIKRRSQAAAPQNVAVEAPKTSKVRDAIKLEIDDTRGIGRDNGIPSHAPQPIQEALTKLTHRNKRVEALMRTMAYRMANLMGRNQSKVVKNDIGFFTVDDIYKMARMPRPEGVEGAMLEINDLRNPAFNKMRKDMRRFAVGLEEGKGDHKILMHEIGHVVAKTSFDEDQWNAINRYYLDALEKGDATAVEMQNKHSPDQAAEEWFVETWAEYLEDRVSKVGKDGQLKLRGTMSTILDRLREYVAYVINGLMGNGSVRQMHRDLTYFGDMFGSSRAKAAVRNSVQSVNSKGMAATVAPHFTRDVIDNFDFNQALAAREFTKASPKDDLYGFVYYAKSSRTHTAEGEYGQGITLMNPRAVMEHGAGAEASMADRLSFKPGTRRQNVAMYLMDQLQSTRLKIEKLMDERIVNGNVASPNALKRLLRDEKQYIDDIRRIARDEEFDVGQVEPMFVRTNKVFDLGDDYVSFSAGRDNSINWFLNGLVRQGLLSKGALDRMMTSVSDEITGSELQALLTNRFMLMDGANIGKQEAKEALANHIRGLGYDAIRYTARDHDGYMMGTNLHVFDAKSVKRVDEVIPTEDVRSLRTSRVGGSTKLNANLAEDMMDQNRPFSAEDFIGMSYEMQRIGAPAAMQPILRKMTRKEPLTGSDIETAQKHAGPNFLSENSSHFRRMGAHWFADIIKPEGGIGLFDRHNSDLSKTMNPVLTTLRNLPDAKNMVGRWFKRSLISMPVVGGAVAGAQLGTAIMPGLGTIGGALGGMALGNRIGKKVPIMQPASHARILSAIREGRGAVALLSADEQRAAHAVIKSFENELERMRKLGIPVGDARKYGSDFYIPQIWDTEIIRDDYSNFVDKLGKFILRQNREDGNSITGQEAVDIAKRIANNMLDTDGRVDVTREQHEMISHNPFYQRILKLKPEDQPELGAFLVNDLEGIITRYFDKTTRKIILAKEFGAGGHGLNAYRAVAELGDKAAAKILVTPQNMKVVQRTFVADVEATNTVVPALPMSEADALELVKRITSMLGDNRASIEANREKAINMIVSKVPADRMTETLEHNLRLRAEGIVNALADFGPIGASARSGVLPQMDRMVNVLNKRPIDNSDGTGFAHRVSHKMRAFNSVTLLGFTTLTSLPDMALPLIRSGKMGAWLKGMNQWYSIDPAYRQAARDIGVGIENLVHDRMVQMTGDGSQRFQNSFFNLTMLTPWTNIQREVAALVGFNALKTEVEVARRYANMGKTDHRNYKRAVRFLERYGLTGKGLQADGIDYAAPMAPRLDDIKAYTQNDQIRYAVMRFTNEAIFTPDPNDVPMWAQTPWGAMVFQLKSYPVMMGRMSAWVASEAKQKNFMPAVYMLTAGTALGAGALALKDVVQSRGGDDERSSSLRNRSLSKIVEEFGAGSDDAKHFLASVGVDPRDVDDADAALGWYIEGLFAMGGLGFIGELLYNSAEKSDNGLYGYVRTMGMLGGPTVGLSADAYNVVAGARDMITDADTDGKKRQAARIVAGRVPIMGGVRDFKEDLADAAGTPGRKKKPQYDYGSGDSYGGGDYDLDY